MLFTVVGSGRINAARRHCCIEPRQVIFTRDLPVRSLAGGHLDRGSGVLAGPRTPLERQLTGDLAVKIAGDRSMQQCPAKSPDPGTPRRIGRC
jgi:hypothetical protein